MTRFMLFLSAFSPGVVVVSIRYLGEGRVLGIWGLVFGLILAPIGLLTVRTRSKTKAIPTELSALKDETYQVPTYLVTFILPFLFVEMSDWQTVVAYAVFILFVTAILWKSDISIVSPGLLILDYRLYDAVDHEGRSISIISRTRPSLRLYENLRYLSGGVYLLEPRKVIAND